MSWSGRRRSARAVPRARTEPDETGRTIAPGTVTAITGQTRDPQRVNVYLDDKFAFGIDREAAARAGLRVGEQLDEARIGELRAADEIARATNAALVFIAYRARSEREVRDRLTKKGYASSAIDLAILRVIDWGYLNDADFARFWTENRVQHKPRGRRLLEQELRQKGVAPEVVRDTLDDAELDDDASALALAHDRLRRDPGANLEPLVRKRRLANFLTRRGYNYDVIKRVMKQVFDEEPVD